jgi:hypothetical protein
MATVKGIAKSVTPSKTDTSALLGTSNCSMNPELKKLMEEESKIVRGRFKNYETPGGNLPFQSRKYPNQEVFKIVFQDGGVYDVPLWVARHLNGTDKTAKVLNGRIGSCSYPVHGFKWDAGQSPPKSDDSQPGNLVPVIGIEKRVQRYGFESLEFDSGSE